MLLADPQEPAMVVWYCKTPTEELGPLSSAALRGMAADGRLVPEDFVRDGSTEAWQPASRVRGLFEDRTTLKAAAADKCDVADWQIGSESSELVGDSRACSWSAKTARHILTMCRRLYRPAGVSFGLHLSVVLILAITAITPSEGTPARVILAVADQANEDMEILELIPEIEIIREEVEVQVTEPVTVEAVAIEAPGGSKDPGPMVPERGPSLEALLMEVTPVASVAATTGNDAGLNGAGQGAGEGNGFGDGVGSGSGHQGESVTFFGLTVPGRRVVFVLDFSTSMNAPISDVRKLFMEKYRRVPTRQEREFLESQYPSKILLLRRELSKSIFSLPETCEFGLIVFKQKPMAFGIRSAGLMSASIQNKKKCLSWIAQMQVSGGTDPLEALLNAVELKPDLVFLLTDAEFDPSYITSVTEKNGGKVPIFTIGIGTTSDNLRRLAEENGGESVFITE